MFIVFTESYKKGIKLRVHGSSQDLKELQTESERIYDFIHLWNTMNNSESVWFRCEYINKPDF